MYPSLSRPLINSSACHCLSWFIGMAIAHVCSESTCALMIQSVQLLQIRTLQCIKFSGSGTCDVHDIFCTDTLVRRTIHLCAPCLVLVHFPKRLAFDIMMGPAQHQMPAWFAACIQLVTVCLGVHEWLAICIAPTGSSISPDACIVQQHQLPAYVLILNRNVAGNLPHAFGMLCSKMVSTWLCHCVSCEASTRAS